LDSAATTINGDLSDAFGFNVSINEIRQRKATRKNNSSKSSSETKENSNKSENKVEELVTIPSDIAELIKQDIERYRQDLLFFKTL
jgi:hypothetical protein